MAQSFSFNLVVYPLVVSSAEAAKEVLKVHDLEYCSRPNLAGPERLTYNYVDVAFAPYGDYWREMRKLYVLELFTWKRVQSFRFVREDQVTWLMDSMSQSSASATPVNLTEMVYALFARIVCRIAFGKSFEGSDPDNDRFQEVTQEAEAVMGCLSAEECVPYIGWIIDRITGHRARIERVFLELDTLFQQVINDHLESGRTEEQKDVIDVLLEMQSEQIESGATRLAKENIKAAMLNIFLAGVDTDAITVIWAMAELARNLRTMKKVQDDIRNYVGKKGRVTEDSIDQLPYLKMVIKETLRLHHHAPLLLPRETMSHCKISGHDIYPKMLVQINAWAIGRDPKYRKDPEESSLKDSSTAPLIIKGNILSFCHLDPVEEFVLGYLWEQQWWSLYFQISCTVLIGDCPMEWRRKISTWKRLLDLASPSLGKYLSALCLSTTQIWHKKIF